MELLKKINKEYSSHKRLLYKKLTTYTMISIKNKVKSNQIIKDNFKSKINELVEIENKTLKDKQTIRNYAFMYKNTKVDWIGLELALINKMALQLNNETYLLYVQSVKKYHSDYEFTLYGENLVSNDLLKKYISKIIKWCKKNYNRMSQIKKVEKLYNQKYYLEHKEQKGIKSREEVNKINGAKRHQDSKTLVLKYALELVAQSEKITIKTIKKIIEQNNEKLGTTQIHNPREVNLICDATFYGKRKDKLGTLVFMDSITYEILIWKHIQTEKVDDYKYLLTELLNLGYTILSATVDGKRGVNSVFKDYPIQMCHFHPCAYTLFERNVLLKDI